MGSMRQLASMFRHVHQAQALGIAKDSAEEPLVLAPAKADITRAGAEPERAGEAAGHTLQQS